MASVDVSDDSIRRFVVQHYRYDPERRERRYVFVDAFDNEAEFRALLESIQADIDRRRAAGEPIDGREHTSGVLYEPGDRRRAANGHMLRRMVEHSVDPRPWVNPEGLPSNISFLERGVAPGLGPGLLGRVHRLIRRWLHGADPP